MTHYSQYTYKIDIFQGGDYWFAGIPELAILKKDKSPFSALQSALDQQEIVLGQLKDQGIPFPPQEAISNNLTLISKIYHKFYPFIFKALITYIFVLGFIALTLLLIYPTFFKYTEQYVLSSQVEKDFKKIMRKLNIEICQKSHEF